MDLKKKKVFIAPYSPITKVLQTHLKKSFDIEVLGFIDKNEEADNIFKIKHLPAKEYDYILIFSPNHFSAIYKEYKTILHGDSKLLQVDMPDSNSYIFLTAQQIRLKQLRERVNTFIESSKIFLLKELTRLADITDIRGKRSVFICEDFIDANMKHLALYVHKKDADFIVLTDNEEQLKILQDVGIKVARLGSFKSYIQIALAKNIIIDHVVYRYLTCKSPKQNLIQLWHGVGLKPINDNSKTLYDYFISPSHWTNDTNFKNVFQAKEFLNLGYPRNDVLLSENETRLDLLLCDMKIYDLVTSNKKQGIKNILYMPTFRENKIEAFHLNLSTLNEECKRLNTVFIIKPHPFTMKKYFDSLQSSIEYSNIIFYTTQGDIYPVLKHIDILITDYSSIAYDFLPLDRPVIFFNYDYDEYIQTRGELLFDYYEYSPGDKVKTEVELLRSIQKNLIEDDYKQERKKMRELFFDYNDALSSQRIFKIIC